MGWADKPRPSDTDQMPFSHWTTRHLYRHCLGKPSRRRSLARAMRRRWPEMMQGDAEGDYFGVHLRFPLHHELLIQTNDFPEFNLPLRRLAALLRHRQGRLSMVDIGANIGDGPALAGIGNTDEFWLIEGSETYRPYLRANTASHPNIHLLETYLGEHCGTLKGHERTTRSTSSIVEGEAGSLSIQTLDALHAEGRLPACRLLKIDVEGHEPRILRGGTRYLSGSLPCLHMEWHPNMLRREGEQPEATLDLLKGLGYTELLVYDNFGYLLTSLALSDAGLRERLRTYALAKPAFYFDLIAFPPADRETAREFCELEKLHVSELEQSDF